MHLVRIFLRSKDIIILDKVKTLNFYEILKYEAIVCVTIHCSKTLWMDYNNYEADEHD